MEIPGSIRWQSRRGMKELDLMLEPFVTEDLPELDEKVLADYAELLKCSDLQLLHFFNGVEQAPTPQLRGIVDLIKSCHQKHRQSGASGGL